MAFHATASLSSGSTLRQTQCCVTPGAVGAAAAAARRPAAVQRSGGGVGGGSSSSGINTSGMYSVGIACSSSRHTGRRAVAAAAAGKGPAGKAASAGKGFGAPKPGSAASKVPTKCPCGSGKAYESCCGRLHAGEPAPDPEALLRARFSAYKLQLADYLVATTHPDNPEHTGDAKTYARAVTKTARANTFISLQVGEQQPGSSGDEAFITFTVQTRPNAPGMQGKPAESVREKSQFVREGGRWLYRDIVE